MSPDLTDEPLSNRSAGVPPAVAGATRPRFGSVHIRDRGRLPHWEKESATYFVTFRLAVSLPKSLLDRIDAEIRYVAANPEKANLKDWK